MPRKNNNAPVDVYVIKIDESKYWNPKIFEDFPEIKKIYGIYITDVNSHTYLAEMTPSNFLVFLENQWDGDYNIDESRAEEIDEIMMEGSRESDATYMHASTVRNIPRFKGHFPKGKIGKKHWHTYSVRELQEEYDGDREAAFEDVIEDFQGNPI